MQAWVRSGTTALIVCVASAAAGWREPRPTRPPSSGPPSGSRRLPSPRPRRGPGGTRSRAQHRLRHDRRHARGRPAVDAADPRAASPTRGSTSPTRSRPTHCAARRGPSSSPASTPRTTACSTTPARSVASRPSTRPTRSARGSSRAATRPASSASSSTATPPRTSGRPAGTAGTRWSPGSTTTSTSRSTTTANPETFEDSYVTDVIAERTNETVREFARDDDPSSLFSWHLAPHYRIDGTARRCRRQRAAGRGPLRRRRAAPVAPGPVVQRARTSLDQPRPFRHRRAADLDTSSTEHRARLRALQSVDRAVGSLVETLRETGELDNTVIVFTSDNGYSLGEHRFIGKNVLTEPVLQVPLLVRGPGIAPGTTSDLPVTLVDLPATFAAIAGGDPRLAGRRHVLGARPCAGSDQPFRDTTLVQTGDDGGDGWAYRGRAHRPLPVRRQRLRRASSTTTTSTRTSWSTASTTRRTPTCVRPSRSAAAGSSPAAAGSATRPSGPSPTPSRSRSTSPST